MTLSRFFAAAKAGHFSGGARDRPLPVGAWWRQTKWGFDVLVQREFKVTDHKTVISNIDESSTGSISIAENRLAAAGAECT
jgi:hypothetical protein